MRDVVLGDRLAHRAHPLAEVLLVGEVGLEHLRLHPVDVVRVDQVGLLEFGGGTGHLATGGIDGYFANGMPEELGLSAENVGAFLRRGEEVFNVNCAICHGKSGDGQGMTSHFGVPGIANLTQDTYGQAVYPDGRIFHVISEGKGNMSGYKHNIALRDRWAVVAYVRALQVARKAPYDVVKDAFDKGIAPQAK